MRVLSLETSTSSAKTLVYDDAQGVVATATEPFGAEIANPGQQDAAGVHAALLRVGRRVAEGQDIAAIGLSSTWHSMGVCDDDFTPITPVYTWEYAQAAPLSADMRRDEALTERLYRATGCMPNITYPRQTLLYLRQQGCRLPGASHHPGGIQLPADDRALSGDCQHPVGQRADSSGYAAV